MTTFTIRPGSIIRGPILPEPVEVFAVVPMGSSLIRAHAKGDSNGGRLGDISIVGQESNPTTRRLAAMNVAVRGIETNLGPEHADSFHRDLHKDLKVDSILANPPLNNGDCRGEPLKDDKRWGYGVPPAGNAHCAWVWHFIHHLAPSGGSGARPVPRGSSSRRLRGDGQRRVAGLLESECQHGSR